MILTLKHRAIHFKNVFSLVKDSLTDVNIKFSVDGMSITGVDPEKISMTHIVIDKFDHYDCVQPFIFGVSIQYLYKLFRGLPKDATLEITALRPDSIKLTISDPTRFRFTIVDLQSIDLPDEDILVPKPNLDSVVVVPTTSLQKIIRELSHIDTKISISTDSVHSLTFEANGCLGSATTKISISDKPVDSIKTFTTYQGSYFVKFIEKFCKFEVSKDVLLNFTTKGLLWMVYSIEEFGQIYFGLSQIVLSD